MKQPEQNLWKRVDGWLAPWSSQLHFERIEILNSSGIPDVLCVCNGQVSWLELKQRGSLPKRAGTRVLGANGLNQDQKNWHMEWIKHGGIVFTLIGIGSYQYWLMSGRLSDRLNDLTAQELTYHSTLQWDSRKEPSAWRALAQVLGAST